MPVPVQCACGKQFRARDEDAGKRGKCPGCGEVLTIPGGGGAAATPPGARVTPRPREQVGTTLGGILQPKVVILIGIGLAIVTGAVLIKMASGAADDWAKASKQGEYDVTDVVTRALKVQQQQAGVVSRMPGLRQVGVKQFDFLESGVGLHMPDRAGFVGVTNALQKFKGVYGTRTRAVEADVTSELGPMRVTGSFKGDQMQVWIDGQQAVLKDLPPVEAE